MPRCGASCIFNPSCCINTSSLPESPKKLVQRFHFRLGSEWARLREKDVRISSHRIPGLEAVCVDEESVITDSTESSNKSCFWKETGTGSVES